ncbi:abortive infection family protein [Streptomyces sp. NPDC057543]|uniref:abortive infection family protein n=1 Tax=Streptomyces sp. NPDC057543 TaxID=3346163 RepID=UPI003675AB24
MRSVTSHVAGQTPRGTPTLPRPRSPSPGTPRHTSTSRKPLATHTGQPPALKTVLDERQVPHDKNDDLLVLLRKTTRCLQLTPDHLDSSAAAGTINRMMMSLGQIVQGTAELRNGYGTGHGRSKAQASQRLTSRHARLVAGSASALGVFLYETHEEGGAAAADGPGL